MRFLDSWDANLQSYQMRVQANSAGLGYWKFLLRFSGAQDGATPPTVANLGDIVLRYHGKQRARWKLSELQYYNSLKGGAVEAVASVNNGDPFSYSFIIPLAHWDDYENVLHVARDTDLRIEWIPEAALAGRVTAASYGRLIGCERVGEMRYIYGANRVDIAMVAGRTRPEPMVPHGIVSIFIEKDANIDEVEVTRNGTPYVSGLEAIELAALSENANRIETSSLAATTFPEIPLVSSQSFLEALLNQDVSLTLTGAAAATVSVFWTYLDSQPTELTMTRAALRQVETEAVQRASAQGGNAAVAVYSVAKRVFSAAE